VSSLGFKRGSFERVTQIRSAGMVVLLAAFGAACEQQEPRSFADFMDDAIARDGALARCNQDRTAAENDIECSNARRAADAVAVAQERAREEARERQSERTLIALRDRAAFEQEAAARAAAEARAAQEAAYDAQWIEPDAEAAPAPEGILAFDVYPEGAARRPFAPSFELSAAAPPASDLTIPRPQLTFDEVAIPRPFRTTVDDAVADSQ
jgi:hypothetical protein